MASLPGRLCHCGRIQPCPLHKRQAYDRERGSSTQRLYGYKWQKARARFLMEHPLCKPCEEEGRTTLAFAVDHRIPHRGNLELFWDESNWDPMCESHHNAKARRERRT
jgi:5-methylcytosine-specific restriction protein A